MTPTMPNRTSRALLRPSTGPVIADLLCVVAFALGGKSTHEAAESDAVVLAIAWPFALAVAIAHAWLLWRGRETRRVWPEGAAVVAVTYVWGMVLRDLSGRGMDGGFLVVAAIFLTATMLGWRAIAGLSSSFTKGASAR